MIERAIEVPPLTEWDTLAERRGSGIHWLEDEVSPSGHQGIFVVVSRQDYWFYRVENSNYREEAEEDASKYRRLLTDPVLRKASIVDNGELNVSPLERQDRRLNWYADTSKPRPEKLSEEFLRMLK